MKDVYPDKYARYSAYRTGRLKYMEWHHISVRALNYVVYFIV
jgi:hypothetical protein